MAETLAIVMADVHSDDDPFWDHPPKHREWVQIESGDDYGCAADSIPLCFLRRKPHVALIEDARRGDGVIRQLVGE